MVQRPDHSGNSLDRFKFWAATVLSGLLSLSGCGGGEAPTQPATEADAGETQLKLDAEDQVDQESVSEASKSQRVLLETAPDQWLKSQIRRAMVLRTEADYQAEVAVWDEVIEGLDSHAGTGYWVTAGARLSRDVAVKLSTLDSTDQKRWKRFQELEVAVTESRLQLQTKVLKGEISQETYRADLAGLIDQCDQQQEIIETIFGKYSHLLGNLYYTKAELLADQGSWTAALVEAERSLKSRQLAITVQHPDTLRSLKLMGRLAKEANQLPMAKECFSRALRQAEHVWGREHTEYADHANDLGVFYYWALENHKDIGCDYAEAGHWLETALKVRSMKLGDGHLLTAMSRRNYALLKMSEGASKPKSAGVASSPGDLDFAVADAAFEAALPVFRKKAADLAMLNQVLIESATAKVFVKEFDAAESRLREVRDGQLAQSQPDALSVGLDELDFRIAYACLKQEAEGKHTEGRSILERLVKSSEETAGARKLAGRASAILAQLDTPKFQPAIKDLPDTEKSVRIADPTSGTTLR